MDASKALAPSAALAPEKQALAPAESKGYSTFSQLEDAEARDALLPPSTDGHYPHLDLWRAICIGVVVLDHGNWRYSEWNLLFGQNWTLQYIFCICGICFGLTRKGVLGYLGRLGCYVIVGVMLNLLANIIAGNDWRKNPWDVVFQFWFVVALMGYSVVLLPLKSFLEGQRAAVPDVESARSQGTTHFLKSLVVLLAGLLTLYLGLSCGLAKLLKGALGTEIAAAVRRLGPGLSFWAGSPEEVLATAIAAIELTLSNVWLAVAFPLLFPNEKAITAWLVFCNMHARRLSTWYSGVGEKVMNGLDLMLLGLVAYYLGLKFRREIGERIARYWFIWLAICGLVWKPGTHGRLDLLMPEEWNMLWRMQFLSSTFMLVFLTAGERCFDPRIFTEDRCYFVNHLGLFLFLVHKAVHIVFPEPWNWLVILSWLPIFWFFHQAKK